MEGENALAFGSSFLHPLRMLLIYPPIAKPSEPPPGLARLAGCLKRHGIACRVLDANIEGILHVLNRPMDAADTWTSRARRHLKAHLDQLSTREGYLNRDRYRRSVLDLNRILSKSAGGGIGLSFANYTDPSLSPVRSGDLLRAAECPERNPFYSYFSQRLRRIIEEESPAAVGLSVNYLSQAISAFAMAGFIRRSYPSLKIILGGGLITSWMRGPGRKAPFSGLIDAMVAGPGEESLVSFLGMTYRQGADVPDYDSLRGNGYFAPGFILPFSASTGCYWHRCRFCPESAEGNPYRPMRPQEAVRQCLNLAERTAAEMVHFVDNAMSPALLEQIAKGPFNHPWYGFVRVTRPLADQDFCHRLKQSGCVMLKLGIESGSQEVLDRLEKGIDLGTVSQALRSLSAAGIGTYVYLLFGTPPEDSVKARETLAFTARHADYIDFLNLAVFNMPAHGPDANLYQRVPFYEGDLSLYTGFVHPLGWDRPLIREFLEKEFHREPGIAAIERRQPPLFTSNHAPFLAGAVAHPVHTLQKKA